MRTLHAVVLFAILAAAAAAARPAPAAAQAPNGRNQIVVSGSGRVEVPPDQAAFALGAQAQRPTAAEAMAEVNRVVAQIVARWQALGIRQEDIRTAMVQVFPVTSTPREGTPQIAAYRASSLLTLTLANLTLVGRALDAAVGAGANTVQGLTFGLRDPSRPRTQALAAAVRDAREKAEALAQAAGLRISGIERIVEEGAVVQPREVRLTLAAPTPVEPGLVTVTAQIQVVFRY